MRNHPLVGKGVSYRIGVPHRFTPDDAVVEIEEERYGTITDWLPGRYALVTASGYPERYAARFPVGVYLREITGIEED